MCLVSPSQSWGAVQSLPVPCASDAALGWFGAASAVVSVLVADQALVPAAFTLCSSTSIAAPVARPDSVYGLETPDTVAQVFAPDGLDRRLNPVVAPCVASTAGGDQVTVKLPAAPCARIGAPGGAALCGVGSAAAALPSGYMMAGELNAARGVGR